MTSISKSNCPQCGAPVKSNLRNQNCQHCGAELVNDSVIFDEPSPIQGTFYLKAKVSEDSFIDRMKAALEKDARVCKDYIELVAETDRELIYVPIVYYKYEYHNADWTGEVSVQQSSGRSITFSKSGRLGGSFTLPVINAKESQLPVKIASIHRLLSIEYDDVVTDGSSHRNSCITLIPGAYDPENSLLDRYKKQVKEMVLEDAKKHIAGYVESISINYNSSFEYKIIYVPYWVSIGHVEDDNYFFLMNAYDGKLSYHTELVGGYFLHEPSFKGYRKMCFAFAIISFITPGSHWSVFFFLAGLLIPKLSPSIYKHMEKKIQRARSFKTSDRVDEFEHVYRTGIVPFIYILTVVAFLYRAYLGLA